MLKAIVNETERVFENIDTHVYDTAGNASVAVAAEIAELIKSKAAKGENCVLGLATGSTPKQVSIGCSSCTPARLLRNLKREISLNVAF